MFILSIYPIIFVFTFGGKGERARGVLPGSDLISLLTWARATRLDERSSHSWSFLIFMFSIFGVFVYFGIGGISRREDR